MMYKLFKQADQILIPLAIFILIIFSIIFAKERILFVDSAFHLFHFINDKAFLTAERFGQIFTQFLPVMGVYMELPITYLVYGYSVNFMLLYVLIFLLVFYVLKDKFSGSFLVLNLLFIVNLKFFWPQSTVLQGIALAILSYAWWFRDRKLQNIYIDLLIGGVLLITAIYLHPLTIIVVVYIFGYEIINRQLYKSWYHLTSVVIILETFIFKSMNMDPNSYDGERMKLSVLLEKLPYVNEQASFRDTFMWFFDEKILVLLTISFIFIFFS